MNNGKIYTIDEIKSIVKPIAEKHKLKKVWIFGSYARGEADEKSDLDFHIDDDGNMKSLFILGGLYADLEEMLEKPFDLILEKALQENADSEYTQRLLKNILRDEVLIYEKLAV